MSSAAAAPEMREDHGSSHVRQPSAADSVDLTNEDAFVDIAKLAKGVRWAIGIEGVVVITVYVVFYIWHLFR